MCENKGFSAPGANKKCLRAMRGTRFAVKSGPGEGGGIGRRTGFRFQRRKAWGFESLPSHQRTGFSGMQTSIEALSRLERRLNMAVPAEQIDPEVRHRERQPSAGVPMEGFRPAQA